MSKIAYFWFGQRLAAWLDIAVGAASLVTLCLYRPQWDVDFRMWWHLRYLRKSIKAATGREPTPGECALDKLIERTTENEERNS